MKIANLLFKSSVSEVLTLLQGQTPHCVVFQTSGGYCCAAFALSKKCKDYNAYCNTYVFTLVSDQTRSSFTWLYSRSMCLL